MKLVTRSVTHTIINSSKVLRQSAIFSLTQRRCVQQCSAGRVEEKYKQKLLERAKAEGCASVEELKSLLKSEIEKKKKEFNKIDPLKEIEEYEQRMKMMSNNSKMTKSKGPVDGREPKQPFKSLDSYLNVEKIKQLSKQEVEFLWRARWMNKENVLNAVVAVDTFERIEGNAKANPSFVLPLPRGQDVDKGPKTEEQGIEMHYVQWQFVGTNTVHCMITSLAEYKLHKEFARPHTTLEFHLDMAKEKKVVLMNGLVEKDTNISLQDAQLLLLNIQRFYGAMGESTNASKMRLKMLRDFTSGSSDFNVDALVALAQSMEN